MYKVVELSDLFLFYYNKRCAYYLPKRAIPTAQQLVAVRAFLRKHASDKADLSNAAA